MSDLANCVFRPQRLSSVQVWCSSDEKVKNKSVDKGILTLCLLLLLCSQISYCISQGKDVLQRLSVSKRSQSAFCDECTCQFDTHSHLIKTSHACVNKMQDDSKISNSQQEPIGFCYSKEN